MNQGKGKGNVKEKKEVWLRRERRGALTWNILKALTHGTVLTTELVMACTPGGKYMSIQNSRQRRKKITEFFEQKKEEGRFYSLLSHLQASGLVIKEKQDEKTQWRITEEGIAREQQLRKRLGKYQFLTPPLPRYTAEKSDDLILVIFDIPERDRFKRHWLRSALQNMGFTMMQESVWAGEVRLPQDFLGHLKELNLTREVKIFSAVQFGNLYINL